MAKHIPITGVSDIDITQEELEEAEQNNGHFSRFAQDFFIFSATSFDDSDGYSYVDIECQDADIESDNPEWEVYSELYEVYLLSGDTSSRIDNAYALMIEHDEFTSFYDERVLNISGVIYTDEPTVFSVINIELTCKGCQPDAYEIKYKRYNMAETGDTAQTLYSQYVKKNVTLSGNTHRSVFDWNIYDVAGRVTQYVETDGTTAHTESYTEQDEFCDDPYTNIESGGTQDEFRFINSGDSGSSITGISPGIYSVSSHTHREPNSIEYENGTTVLKYTTAPEIIGFRTFYFGDHWHDGTTGRTPSTATTPYLYSGQTLIKNISGNYSQFMSTDYKLSEVTNVGFSGQNEYNLIVCGGYGNGMQEIILPSTIKIIGNLAFKNNTLLNNIEFSDRSHLQLEAIGSFAFDNCGNLKTWNGSADIVFPDSLRILGEGCFRYTSIGEDGVLNIPPGLKFIGPAAFQGTNTSRVDFKNANSLLKIGAFAFKDSMIGDIDTSGGPLL
jgi:hypothetical protein